MFRFFGEKKAFGGCSSAKYLLLEIRMLNVEYELRRLGDCESGGSWGQFTGLMVALHPLPHCRSLNLD